MPANKFIAAIVIALMAASWGHTGAAQEQRATGNMNGDAPSPGGWVIELDADGQQEQGNVDAQVGQPAADQTQAAEPLRRSGGAGIEMIVGGQGSGGVAKKETLPIVD